MKELERKIGVELCEYYGTMKTIDKISDYQEREGKKAVKLIMTINDINRIIEEEVKPTPTVLKPSPQLLIKLGSIIVHQQELNSANWHYMDKAALDSLLQDEQVKEWLKEMDSMALLPKKR